jgi:cobalamin-dependent methionine synthase I
MTPRYIYVKTDARILTSLLQGSDIKTHLNGCDEVIILAATLGLQVDELIRRTESSNMAEAVVLDALASEAIEQLCDTAEKEIQLSTINCQLSTRFSPGYGDFPLEVQGELLKLLGAKKKIGLYVSESNLLIPRKSVTAVIGVKT